MARARALVRCEESSSHGARTRACAGSWYSCSESLRKLLGDKFPNGMLAQGREKLIALLEGQPGLRSVLEVEVRRVALEEPTNVVTTTEPGTDADEQGDAAEPPQEDDDEEPVNKR